MKQDDHSMLEALSTSLDFYNRQQNSGLSQRLTTAEAELSRLRAGITDILARFAPSPFSGSARWQTVDSMAKMLGGLVRGEQEEEGEQGE